MDQSSVHRHHGPTVPGASSVWTAGGPSTNGAEFSVLQATSPDGDPVERVEGPSSTTRRASPGGESRAGRVGRTSMTMTLGLHDSPNKLVGDPIDLTATATCTL